MIIFKCWKNDPDNWDEMVNNHAGNIFYKIFSENAPSVINDYTNQVLFGEEEGVKQFREAVQDKVKDRIAELLRELGINDTNSRPMVY